MTQTLCCPDWPILHAHARSCRRFSIGKQGRDPMSSKVTSNTVAARYPLRGRTFLVRRLAWNDSDGLSFDVHDEATGECLTAESFDAEPGPDQIIGLLEGLEFDRDAGTLDPFFDGNSTVLAILEDIKHKHTLRVHVSNTHIVEVALGPDEAITVEVDGREYAGVRVPNWGGEEGEEGVSVTTFEGNDDNLTRYPSGADLSYSSSAQIHTIGDTEDESDGRSNAAISARIEIFEQEGKHWLLITGEMFGPFPTEDDAVDAIPGALRTLE